RLGLPLLLGTRRARWGSAPRRVVLSYFGAIGLGYMAAEIAAIQQLGLLLGHPVYAVSAVLVIFLASSGAGSLWSDRLAPARAGRACAGVAFVPGRAPPSVPRVGARAGAAPPP